jgi:hypothetical protein
MSDTKGRDVYGFGDVITDSSVFTDYDEVAPSRLSDRREDPQDQNEEYDEEPSDVRIPSDPMAKWENNPTIVDQAIKFPHSVRLGPPVTEVFNFSIKEDLDAYNELYARSEAPDGPRLEIRNDSREFHNGVWHSCVTYSKITYKKL